MNQDTEDEYQPRERGEEEVLSPFQSAEKSSSVNIGELVRRIFLLLSILGACFLGYKLIGVWEAKHHQKGAIHPNVTHQTTVLTNRLNDLESQKGVFERQWNQQWQSMMDRENQQSAKLERLVNEVATLKAAMMSQKTLIDQLHQAMIKGAQPVLKLPPPPYEVTAVIPGRAWLKDKRNSKGFTVRIGDNIAPFGYVIDIDVGRSAVILSKGQLILPKPNRL